MSKANVRNDYPYIRAWGRVMGSTDGHYVQSVVEKARADKAPLTAIYLAGPSWAPEGWRRFEQVTNQQTRALMVRILRDEFGITDPPPVDPKAMTAALKADIDYHQRMLERARTELQKVDAVVEGGKDE